MSREEKTTIDKRPISDEQIESIRELASSIQFGKVTLVIQDGVLVQIETTEKVRVR
ncbi:MAG: YezD family protein [Lachnospiraceae bacterium]|nr:YezD family protein [Lachnospiraceae bacterium]